MVRDRLPSCSQIHLDALGQVAPAPHVTEELARTTTNIEQPTAFPDVTDEPVLCLQRIFSSELVEPILKRSRGICMRDVIRRIVVGSNALLVRSWVGDAIATGCAIHQLEDLPAHRLVTGRKGRHEGAGATNGAEQEGLEYGMFHVERSV